MATVSYTTSLDTTRMVCGDPVIEPRIEKCPVRLPLPPAPDASSIFKTQQAGGARSAFAA
jgi:hypothetical protein